MVTGSNSRPNLGPAGAAPLLSLAVFAANTVLKSAAEPVTLPVIVTVIGAVVRALRVIRLAAVTVLAAPVVVVIVNDKALPVPIAAEAAKISVILVSVIVAVTTPVVLPVMVPKSAKATTSLAVTVNWVISYTSNSSCKVYSSITIISCCTFCKNSNNISAVPVMFVAPVTVTNPVVAASIAFKSLQ